MSKINLDFIHLLKYQFLLNIDIPFSIHFVFYNDAQFLTIRSKIG